MSCTPTKNGLSEVIGGGNPTQVFSMNSTCLSAATHSMFCKTRVFLDDAGKSVKAQQWFYYFSTFSVAALCLLKSFSLPYLMSTRSHKPCNPSMQMHCTGAAYPSCLGSSAFFNVHLCLPHSGIPCGECNRGCPMMNVTEVVQCECALESLREDLPRPSLLDPLSQCIGWFPRTN